MTSAQVSKTLIISNSSFENYTYPDDHSSQTEIKYSKQLEPRIIHTCGSASVLLRLRVYTAVERFSSEHQKIIGFASAMLHDWFKKTCATF